MPRDHQDRSARHAEDENSWFIPGFEISRQILYQHIRYYLGPTATVRPFSYGGREGYLVKAAGNGLTENQIQDLKALSRQYEEQAASRILGGEPDSRTVNQPVMFPAAAPRRRT